MAEPTKKESNKTRYVNEKFNDVFREMTSQKENFNKKSNSYHFMENAKMFKIWNNPKQQYAAVSMYSGRYLY